MTARNRNMRTLRYFNFRQILSDLNLEPETHLNWSVGRILVGIARKRGIEPMRLLTEKTSRDPSVRAPHCIAHYPSTMYREALQAVRDLEARQSAQYTLPLPPAVDQIDRAVRG